MSGALLLFLGRQGGFDGWLRLEDGRVATRGPGLEDLPPAAADTSVAAIVPGEEVALHWLDLPHGLAPAQAAAAARLAVAGHSAEALADTHVAIGREQEGTLRCVALASWPAVAEWLARCLEAGLDPDLILPETLLLLPPEEGMARHDRGAISLFRANAEAFALEPELAGLVLAGRPASLLDDAAFEAGLAEVVAHPLVNLRQGPFARRRAVDRGLIRRLALLLAAILLASLAIQFAAIMRYTFAADALESEAGRIAARALPRRAGGTGGPSELRLRLAELRGGGIGFSAIAAPVFASVRATPNAEISALSFTPDGSLKVSVQADSPATLSALGQRIEADGFEVETGPPRNGGGRQVSDLVVVPR